MKKILFLECCRLQTWEKCIVKYVHLWAVVEGVGFILQNNYWTPNGLRLYIQIFRFPVFHYWYESLTLSCFCPSACLWKNPSRDDQTCLTRHISCWLTSAGWDPGILLFVAESRLLYRWIPSGKQEADSELPAWSSSATCRLQPHRDCCRPRRLQPPGPPGTADGTLAPPPGGTSSQHTSGKKSKHLVHLNFFQDKNYLHQS